MFEPTFHPLCELDLVILKKACMGPTLLEKKLLNTGDVSHTRETDLCCDYPQNFSKFHIIPGGRYVLGTECERICLWDLGQPRPFSNPGGAVPIPPCSTLTPPGQNRVFERVSEPCPYGNASIRFIGSIVDADAASTNVRRCVHRYPLRNLLTLFR